MDLSIAYVKNHSQVLYQNFASTDSTKAIIFELEELENKAIHNILLPKSLMEEEDSELLKERLGKTNQYAPIKTINGDQLSAEDFDQLGKEEALKITQQTYSTWTLRNNLQLVENMFANIKHLKNLWPNDRTAFFEELWHLLRKNLGATNLTVAYNHMRKAQKEGEKNQLVRVVVEGQSRPNPSENKELGEALFKNYEGKFANNFETYSYNKEQGKVVFLAQVNDSPIIIMGELFELTALQKATLNCLFEGLQA